MSPVATAPSVAGKSAAGKSATLAKAARAASKESPASEVPPVGKATGKTPAKAVHDKPGARQTSQAIDWQIVTLSVDHIEPSPYQPRLSFDEIEMGELVASIRLQGVQQPVIVRTARQDRVVQADRVSQSDTEFSAALGKSTRYELVTGERRLRASKQAGRRFIPAIVRDDLTDLQAAELALLENVQRSNLTVIEEARGYKRLMIDFRLKEERIARKVGKSVQTVRDTIKLLALPEAVQALLSQKKLTAAHGRELLVLAPFESICVAAAERVVRDNLTALSLQATPLPHAQELRTSKTIIVLDSRTRFDWHSECGKCPHKAYLRSGYDSYCLNPAEWEKKQATAVALQQQEAARVLEEAKSNGANAVESEKLPVGSYRNLSYFTPPSGCSNLCPCRGEMTDSSDPTRKVPVCLQPARFDELREADRRGKEDERRRYLQARWNEAKEKLAREQILTEMTGHVHSVSPEVAALLALPAIRGEFFSYRRDETWDAMVRQAAELIHIELPFDLLLDEGTEVATCLAALQGVPSEQLLLYVACLWLAQEAMGALSYDNAELPYLDAVLGQSPARQGELEEQGDATETAALCEASEGQATYQEGSPEEVPVEPNHQGLADSTAGLETTAPNPDPWPADDWDDDKEDEEPEGDLMDEILRNHGAGVPSDEPYLAHSD